MLRWFLLTLFLNLAACTPKEAAEYKSAMREIEKKHYRTALSYLDKIVKRNAPSRYALDSAKEAAKITFLEVKDYKKSIEYNRFIVLHSENEEERIASQKQIADIYFNNLQDYKESILEYSRLQEMPHSADEDTVYRLNVARAQYYLNNFFQANSEIDGVLKINLNDENRYNALLLKGNVLVAQKDFSQGADIFKNIIEKYPQKALQENIGLMLAVCYEEKGDFKAAIAVLESIRKDYKPPEYIELRIKRLQERLKNAPGARGLKK